MTEWVLRRLGTAQPEFALQEHLSLLKVGRSLSNALKISAPGVSRHQCNLHKVIGSDNHVYWKLEHVSKSSKTFINENEIPTDTKIRLNANDLISFGENLTPEDCSGPLKFLFILIPPPIWEDKAAFDRDCLTPTSDDHEVTSTQLIPSNYEIAVDQITSNSNETLELPKKLKIEKSESIPSDDLKDVKSNIKKIKTDDEIISKKNKRLDMNVVISKMTVPAGAYGAQLSNDNAVDSWKLSPSSFIKSDEDPIDSSEMTFSQVETIIVLDSDDDEDYYNNTLSFCSDSPSTEIKSENKEDSDDDDLQIIEPPEEEEKSEPEVIELDEDDLELTQSQRKLFDKVATCINIKKTEKVEIIDINSDEDIFEKLEAHKEEIASSQANKCQKPGSPSLLEQNDPQPSTSHCSDLIFPKPSALYSEKSTILIKPLHQIPKRGNKKKCTGLKKLAEKKKKESPQSLSKLNNSKLIKDIEKSSSKRKSPSIDEEPAKKTSKPEAGPRMVAETVMEPETGYKTISKLKFNNAITNVLSQNICNVKIPNAKPLFYPGIDKEHVKRKISWKTPLVEIRDIERLGKSRKVENLKDHFLRKKKVDKNILDSSPKNNDSQFKNLNLSIDGTIIQVLSWNTTWLEEQKSIQTTPDVTLGHFTLLHVPPLFDNFEDYRKVFFPLLYYELWRSIFEDFTTTKNQVIQVSQILSHSYERHLISLNLRSLITTQDRNADFYVKGGYLVKVSFYFKCPETGRKTVRPCFGFVSNNNLSNRNMTIPNPLDNQLIAANPKRMNSELSIINQYNVVIKRPLGELPLQHLYMLPTIQVVSYIRPFFRLFKSVVSLSTSPLFEYILKPSSIPKTILLDGPPIEPIVTLNQLQCKIVKDISSTIIDKNEPFVSLIQGPPGTGKSTLIVALICELVKKSKRFGEPFPRILLTAPSNSAVDELLLKLKKVPSIDSEFKMVRVGLRNSVNPEVMDLELGKIVETRLSQMEASSENSKSIQLEISHRQEIINALGAELEQCIRSDSSESIRTSFLERSLKEEQSKLVRAKNSLKSIWTESEKHRKRAEISRKLLIEADLIATTLSSSMNGIMVKHFIDKGVRRPFSVCIMDEASQSVEPEGLIPLSLGFSKMIMVGDPEQLPATVQSPEAKKLSFDQSLFNRLFKAVGSNSFSFKLTTQYRMHPSISRWPNHYFYGGALVNGVGESRNSYLHPLRLFDLHFTLQEYDRKSLFNPMEAKFAAFLVKTLLNRFEHSDGPPKTIGVITFYARQRDHLSLELQNLGISTSDDKRIVSNTVMVRTVDGFQGSECDIIVISCVRTCGKSIGFVAHSERLNVALTRAKYALYVIGNFKELSRNNMWSDFLKDANKKSCVIRMKMDEERGLEQYIFKKSL